MTKILKLLGLVTTLVLQTSLTHAGPLTETTQKIQTEIQLKSEAFQNLKELTQLGHRLAGSPGSEKAIQWAKKKMETYGLSEVRLQPVMIPQWIRGDREKATLTGVSEPIDLKVTALGKSIGTGPNGIEAEVIEVKSLKEVAKLGDKVRGKIVFFNNVMEAPPKNQLEAYGNAMGPRMNGASHAGNFGALAVLVRSVTPLLDDDHPHTGTLQYLPGIPKIPAAALSTRAANTLSKSLKINSSLKVKLELSAQTSASKVLSYNVIGEIPGESSPRESIVLGGHLDSWDLGVGAHDDGAGIVHSLEVMRAFKVLKIRPKRTIRVVLFMDEESTASGAYEFAKQAKANHEKIILALESDLGGHAPTGFSYVANKNVAQLKKGTPLETFKSWKKYLDPLKASEMSEGDCGVDVYPLLSSGAICVGFIPEMDHYFEFHHSALDQLETVNPAELTAGASAIATFIYLASETLEFM